MLQFGKNQKVGQLEETMPLFITSRSETDLAFTGSGLVTSVNILSTYKLLSSNHTPKTKPKIWLQGILLTKKNI